MGSKIKSMKKAKAQIDDMKKKMNSYSKKIEECCTNLSNMMKGNGTDAYWQGQNATDWYTKAIKYMNSIIDNYKHSYDEFADYAKIYDRASVKGNLKGLTKATMKSVLAKYDGSQYVSGVKKNMDNKKFTTLPATVKSDTVNDDQTRESYRCYTTLKKSFEELVTVCEQMKTSWSNIKSNTTGTMNSDASKRASYMTARKKNINVCIDDLETNYIGDILFSR